MRICVVKLLRSRICKKPKHFLWTIAASMNGHGKQDEFRKQNLSSFRIEKHFKLKRLLLFESFSDNKSDFVISQKKKKINLKMYGQKKTLLKVQINYLNVFAKTNSIRQRP